jgi:hypothetical protein
MDPDPAFKFDPVPDPYRLKKVMYLKPVLRICIRMDPHFFGLLDPHPESAFQMQIIDAT